MINRLICWLLGHRWVPMSNEHWLDAVRYQMLKEVPTRFITIQPEYWDECTRCGRVR